MMRMSNNSGELAGVGVCLLVAGICMAPATWAAGIPYAGNRPQSFQFSSEFTDSYNSFGQYLQWNDDSRRFDDDGREVAGSGTDTYVGLSSLLHYWKVDGLPNNAPSSRPTTACRMADW